MMKMIFSLTIMIISIIMFFIYHPLSMGIFILIQTLMLCMLLGLMMNSYWFSYILFLTFLGGLLILFIYISSIASNEIFQFPINYKLIIIPIKLIMVMLMIFFFKKKMILTYTNFNDEMINFFNFSLFFNNENFLNLTKLYNTQTYMLMMMMIIYLFITLIAVVKITNIFLGPLRSFN